MKFRNLASIALISVFLSILFFNLGYVHSSLALSPPATQWEKTFGGYAVENGYSVVQASDGGYAIAGYTNGGVNGGYDGLLVKTDASGNQQWAKNYGGSSSDYVYSMVRTSDGGYALAGYTYSYGYGGWLVKTDASGNVQWNKTYGGSGVYVYSVVQASDGGYALAGYTYSSGNSNGWLAKTDASGNVQWNKTYSMFAYDYVYSVVQASDGGYALAGYVETGGINNYDAWLVKTDSLGNAQWSKTFGGTDYEYVFSMVQASDGGYVLGGTKLFKTDASGNQQWVRDYGQSYWAEARSIVRTSDGGYALAGYTDSYSSSAGKWFYDAWLAKADSSGFVHWSKTYGGSVDDYGYCVVQASDGGYAVGGFTSSYSVTCDFYLFKTDTLGNQQWSRNYGDYGPDVSYSVVQTSDGGYALAGQTYVAQSSAAWLIKTDASGNIRWNKTYGGNDNDYPCAYSVIQTSDGGYALAGQISGGASTSWSIEAWLVKTDASGNVQWNKTYGGTGNEYAYSIIKTSDGGYALAGYVYSYSPSYSSDFYLAKTDASGNLQWNKTYGGSGYDYAYSVVQASDGGFALAGYTQSSSSGYDFLVVKTDAAGNIQWNSTSGVGGDDYARSVVKTNDGGYALGGYTYSQGSYKIWLVKIDVTGKAQWNKTLGGPSSDYAYSMVQTNDGGFVLAGNTYSYGVSGDGYLVKTDGSGNMQWNTTYGGSKYDQFRSVVQTNDGGFALGGTVAGAGGTDAWLIKTTAPPPDTTAPVTSISLGGTMGENNWYTSNVQVTLSATDDTAVQSTAYNLNSGTWYTTTAPFTITTEGTTTVYYRSTDTAGNIETAKTQTVKIDKTQPTGSIIINDGAASTATTSVTLKLAATDATSGIANVRFSNDSVTYSPWQGYSTSTSATLTSGDGTKTVYAQFRDTAGLISTTYSDTINLAGIPPLTASATASSSQVTIGQSATLTVTASGGLAPLSYQWYEGTSAMSGQTSTQLTVTKSAAGLFSYYCKVTDSGSRTANSNPVSITFVVPPQKQPPVARFVLSPSTQEVGKSMSFDGSSSSDSDGTIMGYAWDFGDGGTASGVTSSHTYASAGTLTVKLTVTDNDGLINSTTLPVTVTSPPKLGSININGGASSTNTTAVTLSLDASSSSGVSQMRFSNDNVGWSDWQAYAAFASWTLSAGDGTKTVYVQFKDNAGLVSPFSDTITLQSESPEGGFPLELVAAGVAVAVVAVVAGLFVYKWWKKRPKKLPMPSQLRITADPTTLIADGETKSIITMQLLDKNGNPMSALADTQVRVNAGKGTMEDSVVTIPKGKDMEQTVLVSSKEAGAVPVSAMAEGLKSITITLNFLERPRYCMHCGTQMASKARACKNCGLMPPAGADTKVCPNCDSVIPIVAKFCGECGTGQKE